MLMPLADALSALGGRGTMGRRHDVVRLEYVVGSASRSVDFDADFRLTNPALRRRLERRLVGRRGILHALNRLRARFGRPPIRPPSG